MNLALHSPCLKMTLLSNCWITITLLYFVLCFFGLITYSLFLLIVLKVSSLHTITYILLSSLACSDLTILITHLVTIWINEFNSIDHNILLNKLSHYGFRGISYDWFQNYLCNRKQYVSYNSSKSTTENVTCGVPQGSILGPLLFILYMNDISYTSSLLNTILFADDTTVFYSHEDMSILCRTVNSEIKEVSNWFKANKLSLNAKKTNLMYLGTCMQTKKMAGNNNYDIYLDGCKLKRVHEAKFLGITIDENFTFKKHVENVCKLCSRNIGVLSKVKGFLPTNAMYRLYCSLVLPYLNYGLLLWGNANKYHINKVFRLQKRAMRLISNSEYLSPTKPLFEKFNTLNIFDMYTKEVAIFMFKYMNNMLPVSFDNFLR